MTTPAETTEKPAEKPAYNWEVVTGENVERLRKPKTIPVPDAIVKLAQASWDQSTAKRHRFGSDAEAAEFARLMRKAGDHTVPLTSVSVVIDPDDAKDLRRVSWQANKRRGRNANGSAPEPASE